LRSAPDGTDLRLVQAVDRARSVTLRRRILEIPLPQGRLAVLTCKRPDGSQPRGAVLLVHGFAQNRFSWHQPERSFANFLVSRGLEIFNLELPGHGLSREAGSAPALGFDDYVADLPQIVARVTEAAGGLRLFTIGHSLGASILFAAAPEMPGRLAGLVSLAGLFGVSFGSLGVLDRVAGLGSTVAAISGLSGWRVPVPIDHLGKILLGGMPLFDSRINPVPFLPWRAGGAERPVIRARVREGFDRASVGVGADIFAWAGSGRFTSRDGSVDYGARFAALEDLPLLVVTCDRDKLAAPEIARAPYWASRSRDRTLLEFTEAEHGVSIGHLDLICGRHAPRLVWPAIGNWIEARLPLDSRPGQG